MILCRICSARPATTTMPFTKRPCCQRCRDRVDGDIARLRVSSVSRLSPIQQAKERHPSAKRRKAEVYRYHYNEVVTD